MANHPNRSKADAESIAVDAALKAILKGSEQYRNADTEGRRNIRRNIGSRLSEAWAGHTAEQLVTWYNRNGITASEF